MRFLCFVFLLLLALNPGVCISASAGACSVWARKVLPSLFPFMVLSRLCSASGGIFPLVCAGWLCGSPGGAALVKGRYAPGQKPPVFLAAVTGTMSPMFFLGTLGQAVGAQASYLLLACHWAGALFSGLLAYGAYGRPEPFIAQQAAKPSLGQTVGECAQAMLLVCGLMMLGFTASALLASLLPLGETAQALLQGMLEVTGGCLALCRLHPGWLLPLLSGLTGFGGLSILLQNVSFYQGTGVKIGQLLWLRLAGGLFSAALCYPLAGLVTLPAFAPVFSPGKPSTLLLLVWLLCFCPLEKQKQK